VFLSTSNVNGRQRGPKRKFQAGFRTQSLKPTSHVAMHFHRRLRYRALSLHYAFIQSSGIILTLKATFVSNLVSFVASTAI